MRLKPESRIELIESSIGDRPMDLVIKNVRMLNCFTGEIYPAQIGIYGGFIAHISSDPDNTGSTFERMEAKSEYDGKGMYVIPGLIDSHIHIESTMMTPYNFAASVIPHGTTTVITDPHEAANVMGMDAVRYMLESSEELPMRQYVLVPSCVPSVPGLENSGAFFGEKEISEMLKWDRVIGLAEVMDPTGVITRNKRMTGILDAVLDSDGFVQGHSPFLGGRKLSAYLCGGPQSDHESSSAAEIREKLRSGMAIDARESSIVRNLRAMVEAVKGFNYLPNLSFCTDDREPFDLINEGHMDYVVSEAIRLGMDPVRAVICATYNAAREIGIENLGAIAPGFAADLLIVPSLTEIKPSAVFFGGKLVAENGRLTFNIQNSGLPFEKNNTVYLAPKDGNFFRIKAPIENGLVDARVITYSGEEFPITSFTVEKLQVVDGYLDISKDPDLKYAAVLNRHKNSDSYCLGVIRNFGIKKGTVASTVSHDSHNLTIVYSVPEEAALAANELIACGGGIVCVENENVRAKLELPICGLMSTASCGDLAGKSQDITEALKSLGLCDEKALLKISTMTLPVIPFARITDAGLVSVDEQELVNLFPG